MEIMFEDLTPEAQERLLREACVSRPDDMDWDELPVTIVELSTTEFKFNDDDFDDVDDEDNSYEGLYDGHDYED